MPHRDSRLALAMLALTFAPVAPALAQADPAVGAVGASYARGDAQMHGHAPAPAPATVPLPVTPAVPPQAQAQAVDPQARQAWLAECERRLVGPDMDRWERKRDWRLRVEDARHSCATYLDGYLAWAASAARPVAAQAHYAPVAGGRGCCQDPSMAVEPRARPGCTETVEEFVEDVPVRARPRIRNAPDKRVRVQ